MMRLILPLVFMVIAMLAGPASAQSAVIDANVGPDFSVSMGPVPGPGVHTVRVVDRSSSHNFVLRAPDGSIVASTTVTQTGTFDFVVTFVQGTYTFECSPHSGSMAGSVVVPPPPPPPPPTNLTPPLAAGPGTVGAMLVCSHGLWSNDPTSYAIQWRRDGVSLPDVTGPNYQVARSDAGSSIGCRVTATNAGGANTADSAVVPILAPVDRVAAPAACSARVEFKHLAPVIEASWSSSAEAHSYEVSIARDGSSDYAVAVNGSEGTSAAVIASAGAKYELRVRARGATGLFSGYCRVSTDVPSELVRFGSLAGGTLFGWVGDDSLLGSAVADQLYGFSGRDRVVGRSGDDQLFGGPGNDSLVGNDGDDVIIAGRDADTVRSGPGNDRIQTRDGSSGDVVACGTGNDRVLADVGDRVSVDCERVLRSSVPRTETAAVPTRAVVLTHD